MTDSIGSLQHIASTVSENLQTYLRQAEPIGHGTTKGTATEDTWIKLFQKYLPSRFNVGKGVIFDSNGETSGQIDCVIFDAHFTPQIIPKKNSLYIPAEAVHAVFEVKQVITKETLEYAADKISSVRKLKRTTTKYVGDGKVRQPKEPFKIIGGLLATRCGYKEGLHAKDFISNLEIVARKVTYLDIIFSADVGYADFLNIHSLRYTKKESCTPKAFVIQNKTGISYGLFRLLEALTQQGTVPAVNWDVYLKSLPDPEALTLSVESFKIDE